MIFRIITCTLIACSAAGMVLVWKLRNEPNNERQR